MYTPIGMDSCYTSWIPYDITLYWCSVYYTLQCIYGALHHCAHVVRDTNI